MDLLQAFTSWNSSFNFFKDLMETLKDADPAVAVLALEGLYRIESNVGAGQFAVGDPESKNIRAILRKWRRDLPLTQGYAFKRVPVFLRSLTIFKTLKIPLFIDDYGGKELLSSYGDRIEDIKINKKTPIFHDTHYKEARKIVHGGKFKPSDKKNIIKGCWFSLENSLESVYGSKRFKTTLSKLLVTELRQGEIVSYKNEVNVILYAAGGDDYDDDDDDDNDDDGGGGENDDDAIDDDDDEEDDGGGGGVDNGDAIDVVIDDDDEDDDDNGGGGGGCGGGNDDDDNIDDDDDNDDDDDDDASFKDLKKPTDAAVKEKKNLNAYVNVSIFVPSRFLPSRDKFCEVFSGPTEVTHGPFCVRASRTTGSHSSCNELNQS